MVEYEPSSIFNAFLFLLDEVSRGVLIVYLKPPIESGSANYKREIIKLLYSHGGMFCFYICKDLVFDFTSNEGKTLISHVYLTAEEVANHEARMYIFTNKITHPTESDFIK